MINSNEPKVIHTMQVEVMFALPHEQLSIPVEVSTAATVEEAIRESKIIEKYPEIDLAINKTGIFGKPAKLDARLHQGDRVEIYRPLLCDPKEMRKLRAKNNARS